MVRDSSDREDYQREPTKEKGRKYSDAQAFRAFFANINHQNTLRL